jgi:hypothetical protein
VKRISCSTGTILKITKEIVLMKKIVYLMIALALIAVLAVPGFSARAQSATAQSWTSSITYYTPSATSGTLTVKYYSGASEYTAPAITLSLHKAGPVHWFDQCS